MSNDEQAQTAQGEESLVIPEVLKDKDLGATMPIAPEPPAAEAVVPTLRHVPAGLSAFVEETHAYVREYISLADQKAAFVFAASTAMLVFIYREGALDLWYFNLRQWGIPALIAFVTTASLFLSAGFAVATVWPRLRGKASGIVFWKAIAAHSSCEDYVRRLEAMSDDMLVTEKAGHLYEIASVCARKYRWITFSIWSAALGLLLSVLLIVSDLL